MTENTPTRVSVEDLTFRPMQATEEDLELFRKCFEDNDLPRSIEMLRWQYLQPPGGPLLVDLAVTPSGNSLAAIYAVFPVAMRTAGRRTLGVQSLNTLTDEAYRGKGLFTRLATSLYERSRAEGVELVYGFPNANSAHGIFKRLEWKTLDPMPFMILPLRTSYVLKRLRLGKLARLLDVPLRFARKPKLAPGRSFRILSTLGSEFDAIWNSFSASIDFAVERDAEYLNWRLHRPGEDYECLALMEGERPIGLAITAIRRSGQDVVGKLMELMFDPADQHAGKLLLRQALARLRDARCGAVWAWNFAHSPNHRVLRNAGFIPLSERWFPAEAHAGVRAFTPLEGIDQRERWYISYLDSDTD